MHVPSSFRGRRTSVELQLTPLIDCVFLLLVYFLWSSSFAVAERSLPGRLAAAAPPKLPSAAAPPAAAPSPEADFGEIVIRVGRPEQSPRWTVNGAPAATLAELSATLTKIARIQPAAPLVLEADGGVPLGDLIDVFDLAQAAGFSKIQFAAFLPEA